MEAGPRWVGVCGLRSSPVQAASPVHTTAEGRHFCMKHQVYDRVGLKTSPLCKGGGVSIGTSQVRIRQISLPTGTSGHRHHWHWRRMEPGQGLPGFVTSPWGRGRYKDRWGVVR
eukprot:EG_transcript_30442